MGIEGRKFGTVEGIGGTLWKTGVFFISSYIEICGGVVVVG